MSDAKPRLLPPMREFFGILPLAMVGLMLVIAGIIKIVTVRIWHGLFDSDAAVGK